MLINSKLDTIFDTKKILWAILESFINESAYCYKEIKSTKDEKKMLANVKAILSQKDHFHTAINSAIAILMRVLGACMTLLFNILVARHLGPEQAGYFFLSLAIVMLLSYIACLGFENTVLRYTSANVKHGFTIKNILNFALKYSLPVACILALVLYFSASFIANNIFKKISMESGLQYIAPSIIGLSMVSIVAMSLQARHKLLLSIPCQNMAHFLLCGAAILSFNISSANIVALCFSLSVGFTASLFYWIAVKSLNNLGDYISPTLLWQSTMPNWATVLMSQLVQWGAPIIVGVYLAAEQVAFFSVAQRLALLTSFILVAVNLVVAPKFAALNAKNDIEGIRRTAVFSVRLLVISSMPILILMLLMPEFLMGLFGEQFKQGALTLQILVLGQAINVITGSVGFLLMMSGNERDMRFVAIVSGLSMLVFAPIFTKLFGAIGAASVTALCVSSQCLMAVFFVKKRLGINTIIFWQKI